MSTEPCDQIAADIIAAQEEILSEHGTSCSLSPNKINSMIDEMEALHESDTGWADGDILGYVLQMSEPFTNDFERECYKKALEKIFTRRAHAKA